MTHPPHYGMRCKPASKMTRLRGRAPRGKRPVGEVAFMATEDTGLCGSRRSATVTARCVIGSVKGSTSSPRLRRASYCQRSAGDSLSLDHLSAHKVPVVREAIETAGATICLPLYSPGLNPVEQLFARLKSPNRPKNRPGDV
jgi:hypothetical protein